MIVPLGRLRAARDDRLLAGDRVGSQRIVHGRLESLARDGLAAREDLPVGRLGVAQKRGGSAHGRLGGPLSARDAGELVRVLGAAAGLEQPVIRRQLEPRLAEAVPQLQREGAGRDGLRDAHAPARSHDQLLAGLLPVRVALDELIPSELLGQDHLDVRRLLVDRLHFELADDRVATAIHLRVQEGIHDLGRHLVAHLGRADRVSADEDGGHGAECYRGRDVAPCATAAIRSATVGYE